MRTDKRQALLNGRWLLRFILLGQLFGGLPSGGFGFCFFQAFLFVGLGDDADWAVDNGLAGQPAARGPLFEHALFNGAARRQVLHPFNDVYNAGAALAIAPTLGQFANEGVDVDIVLLRFEPEVRADGSVDFLIFFNKLNTDHNLLFHLYFMAHLSPDHCFRDAEACPED